MINNISEGDAYLLNFSVISNSNTAKLCINYTGTTGTNPKTYTTSTTRKEYSIPITFNDIAGGTGQYLYFTLHDKGAKVWLDNITVQKVTVNQTSAATSMRFDVNPTDNPMQINLGTSTYKDIFGNSYSGTYTLEPYGSRVLQSYSLTTIDKSIDNQVNDKIIVYPSPNSNSQALRLSIYSSDSNKRKIKILSINGELMYNRLIQLNEGTTEINLPTLNKGVYLLESISENGKTIVTKFVQ